MLGSIYSSSKPTFIFFVCKFIVLSAHPPHSPLLCAIGKSKSIVGGCILSIGVFLISSFSHLSNLIIRDEPSKAPVAHFQMILALFPFKFLLPVCCREFTYSKLNLQLLLFSAKVCRFLDTNLCFRCNENSIDTITVYCW